MKIRSIASYLLSVGVLITSTAFAFMGIGEVPGKASCEKIAGIAYKSGLGPGSFPQSHINGSWAGEMGRKAYEDFVGRHRDLSDWEVKVVWNNQSASLSTFNPQFAAATMGMFEDQGWTSGFISSLNTPAGARFKDDGQMLCVKFKESESVFRVYKTAVDVPAMVAFAKQLDAASKRAKTSSPEATYIKTLIDWRVKEVEAWVPAPEIRFKVRK